MGSVKRLLFLMNLPVDSWRDVLRWHNHHRYVLQWWRFLDSFEQIVASDTRHTVVCNYEIYFHFLPRQFRYNVQVRSRKGNNFFFSRGKRKWGPTCGCWWVFAETEGEPPELLLLSSSSKPRNSRALLPESTVVTAKKTRTFQHLWSKNWLFLTNGYIKIWTQHLFPGELEQLMLQSPKLKRKINK